MRVARRSLAKLFPLRNPILYCGCSNLIWLANREHILESARDFCRHTVIGAQATALPLISSKPILVGLFMFFAAFRRAMCAVVCLLPSIAIIDSATVQMTAAHAQAPSSAEKDAFESAKELGTVEAWDAFLSNYATGFHADLARAYVKKLADEPTGHAPPSPVEPAPQSSGVVYANPEPAGSWGGIVRSGPGQNFTKVESLDEGERIMLIERTEAVTDGFPWFKISFRGGRTGYKWGGILCSVSGERTDIFKTCPAAPEAKAQPSNNYVPEKKSKSSEAKVCSKGRVMVDGRCIRKRDASTSCGPGYRLKGNSCVPGYKEPKPQKQLPSWQIEAMKHGCKKGMGWNAQEGCHEND